MTAATTTGTERPIIFSGPMVRAIREGRKTQTRRIVKPQPVSKSEDELEAGDVVSRLGRLERCEDPRGRGKRAAGWLNLRELKCPYGAPGDRLWVRETLRTGARGNHEPRKNHLWRYAADNEVVCVSPADANAMVAWAHHKDVDVCPSIFMPRWASRITLEIEAVRVERLQDISESDACAEGLREWPRADPHHARWSPGLESGPMRDVWEYDPREAFRIGWDAINGDRGPWTSNPWVWVITFRRVA